MIRTRQNWQPSNELVLRVKDLGVSSPEPGLVPILESRDFDMNLVELLPQRIRLLFLSL